MDCTGHDRDAGTYLYQRFYGKSPRINCGMGPTLLSQLLELNTTQEDILTIVFKIADDNQWLLLDMKDLREMLQYVSQIIKNFLPITAP